MSIPFIELSFLIFNTIAHLNSIKHLAVLHSCFMLSCKHAITFPISSSMHFNTVWHKRCSYGMKKKMIKIIS